jgi:hypothetical protein
VSFIKASKPFVQPYVFIYASSCRNPHCVNLPGILFHTHSSSTSNVLHLYPNRYIAGSGLAMPGVPTCNELSISTTKRLKLYLSEEVGAGMSNKNIQPGANPQIKIVVPDEFKYDNNFLVFDCSVILSAICL